MSYQRNHSFYSFCICAVFLFATPLIYATEYYGAVNYAPIDMFIPSKLGVTFGWKREDTPAWEIEYLRGSVSAPFVLSDIGGISDSRLSINRRSYFWQYGFNWSYGLSYMSLSAHIGDKLLNNLSSGNYPYVDVLKVDTLGFNLAFGNRWNFKENWIFGVDWLSWTQPVYITNERTAFLDYATNTSDRDTIETALKLISYSPRLSALKIQIGYLF